MSNNNKKIRVLSVFGTRPEAAKMGPVVDELRTRPSFDSLVCVTAQHREMLDQVLEVFKIKPDYDLNIMQKTQSLEDIITACLTGLCGVIRDAMPDIVLVHGDTSTTFAASLAAFYSKTKLGHVEAGLRTGCKHQPFPEEINRRLTSVMADFHFAPTHAAKRNLLAEGLHEKSIFVTGNTAVDCLRYSLERSFENSVLANLNTGGKRIITMTAHRRENIGKNLDNILKAVLRIAREYPDVLVIYPIHPNPSVLQQAKSTLRGQQNILTMQPLSMTDMHNLIARSYIVLTDSGGIQEEAPGLNVPVVVLRNVTERPEGIEAGAAMLAGTQSNDIYSATKNLLDNKNLHTNMAAAQNPYGNGFAAKHIASTLMGLL